MALAHLTKAVILAVQTVTAELAMFVAVATAGGLTAWSLTKATHL